MLNETVCFWNHLEPFNERPNFPYLFGSNRFYVHKNKIIKIIFCKMKHVRTYSILNLNWFQRVKFLFLKVEIPLLFWGYLLLSKAGFALSGEVLFLLERDSLKWLGCQVCDASSFQLSLHSEEMWGRAAPQPSQYWYCTMAVEARAPASNLPWQTMQDVNDSRCDITNKREIKWSE